MVPKIQGVIARRVLLNFRANADVVQRLLPAPLEVELRNGQAVVGVCLIRLEQERLRGLPQVLGFTSENMAHRVAIRYPSREGVRPGVFIWRRETDQKLVELVGGRVFPGVHLRSQFNVTESTDHIAMDVASEDGVTDVKFSARVMSEWKPTPSFASFEEASDFFHKGDCGFSCSRDGSELEGLQLKTQKWEMLPLEVESQHAAFYADTTRFPAGSIEFDCALLMRGIAHEWHELADIPRLSATPH